MFAATPSPSTPSTGMACDTMTISPQQAFTDHNDKYQYNGLSHPLQMEAISTIIMIATVTTNTSKEKRKRERSKEGKAKRMGTVGRVLTRQTPRLAQITKQSVGALSPILVRKRWKNK